jgi:hypothetical protein
MKIAWVRIASSVLGGNLSAETGDQPRPQAFGQAKDRARDRQMAAGLQRFFRLAIQAPAA